MQSVQLGLAAHHRAQGVTERLADDREPGGDADPAHGNGADSQEDERPGHGSHALGGVLSGRGARLAKEGEEHGAERVERGEKRGSDQDPEDELMVGVPGISQDFVLRPEAGRDHGKARQSGGADDEGPACARHAFEEAAHIHHVLRIEVRLGGMSVVTMLVVAMMVTVFDAVDDRARAQEEQRFEEGVHEQVEDGGDPGANAQGGEHEPELGDGRIGQDFFDVVLGYSDGGGEQSCERADESDKGHSAVVTVVGGVEQGEHANDEVHARRYHGGGMDESGDGRRALHGVGQPHMQRKLGRLTNGAPEDEDGDDHRPGCLPEHGEVHREAGDVLQRLRFEKLLKVQGPGEDVEEDKSRQKQYIPDAGGEKGFQPGFGGSDLLEGRDRSYRTRSR